MDEDEKIASAEHLGELAGDSAVSYFLPPAIGRYRVIRLLGDGEFGRAYLAHDDKLDRSVAIKVLSPEQKSPSDPMLDALNRCEPIEVLSPEQISRSENVEAYRINAEILARLDHPHIVPVML
jgi:serine/threonine protein kinase